MPGTEVKTTIFAPGPTNHCYFAMYEPLTNVNLTTWAVYGDLGIDPAGRRPDNPSFYVLPGANPATDWASRNATGFHISIHGPKQNKPKWKAHVRGTGDYKMGTSAKGEPLKAKVDFLGAPVIGQLHAFAPLVIRTTKASFTGADLTYAEPDIGRAPGFLRTAPTRDDVAHDLVFIINRDYVLLTEKSLTDNAVPAIFRLPIADHVWYLHIESQVNEIAAVPSPPFVHDAGLYFVRQSGSQESMLWVHEQAPRSAR